MGKFGRNLRQQSSGTNCSPDENAEEIDEGEELLSLVDAQLNDKPTQWFDTKPSSSSSFSFNNALQTKMIFDNIVERLRCHQCNQTLAIADGIIYKMSAPYRHMKFWLSTRHAFKEFMRANSIDILELLKSISSKILSSNYEYNISAQTQRYIWALVLAHSERLARSAKLAILAASNCIAHMALGHLVQANIVLLSVLSDIYKFSLTKLDVLRDCYSSLKAHSIDSRFPASLDSLRSVKELLSIKNNVTVKNGFKSDLRQVFKNALRISNVDMANAAIMDSENRRTLEQSAIDLGVLVERSTDRPATATDDDEDEKADDSYLAKGMDDLMEISGNTLSGGRLKAENLAIKTKSKKKQLKKKKAEKSGDGTLQKGASRSKKFRPREEKLTKLEKKSKKKATKKPATDAISEYVENGGKLTKKKRRLECASVDDDQSEVKLKRPRIRKKNKNKKMKMNKDE